MKFLTLYSRKKAGSNQKPSSLVKVKSRKPQEKGSKKKKTETSSFEEIDTSNLPLNASPENTLPSRETVFIREFSGIVICALVSLVFITLLSHWVSGGGEGNILGPKADYWIAQQLILALGRLPSLVFALTLFVLGISFVRWRGHRFPFIWPLTLAFVLFFSLLLLSIQYIDHQTFIPEEYRLSGGYLGNFLVQSLYVPIFGTSKFGPYTCTLLGLLLTLIWGFKIGISQVMEKTGEFMGVVAYPLRDGWVKAVEKKKLKSETSPQKEMNPDFNSPSFFDSSDINQEFNNSQVVELNSLGKKTSDSLSDKKRAQPITKAVEKVRSTKTERFELPENLEDADPLLIRKLRDREAEIRRVAELNEWETQFRDPEIAGMIRRKSLTPEKDKKQEGEDLPETKNSPRESVKNSSEGRARKRDLPENSGQTPAVSSEKFWEEEGSEFTAESEIPESEEAPVSLRKTSSAEGSGHYASIPLPIEESFEKYQVPSIEEVFKDPPIQKVEYTESDLKAQAQLLEEQLANFRVMGKVVGICTGPVIIRYEVELAPGVKVSQISGLSDDLALALRAKSIRILTPIPGKSAVGIEVPNKKPQVVYIKDVLRSPSFKPEPETIKLVLGQDIAGEPMVMDLTKAPHLLIAGQTGSGKSVCINSFMASLLFSKTPDEIRLILVDPKVVELKPYENIPHLLAPVVTQPEIAVQALKWSTYEMDRRYEILAQAGVRNIKGYNQKVQAGTLPESISPENRRMMPRIVIVIDELADLMMVAGKEVETSIARIAQKARAVGIHLILATQRPSTNVITGTIKANLPTRVAFQVASQIDARTIMDKAGSEKLLGRGDMLFRSIDSPEPERIHGAFVDDEEAEMAARAASSQNVCYPQIPSFETSSEELEMAEEEAGAILDSKFRDAAELVVAMRQASVSLLQRRMSIGYARSGRIVDQLEKAGIVGKDRGSKPREVLMDEVELLNYFEIHNL